MSTITIEIPYGLGREDLVSDQEPADRIETLQESFQWLAANATEDERPGGLTEVERIITAAACAIAAGVEAESALHTAIIWERG